MFRPLHIALLASLAALSLFADDLSDQTATVERIRGLKFVKPVEQKTMARADLRKFITAQLEKELPVKPDQYLRVMDALELIDKKPDTLDKLLALYEAQVLAFYDPSTHVYYSLDKAPEGAEEFGEILNRAVEIHELTHALQDQRFNAGERLESLRGNSDAQMAYQAVIEGEAMLVMTAAFIEPLGQTVEALVKNEQLLATMATMADMTAGIPDGVPPYFVESLKFPYLEGMQLVIAAYRRDGWSGVDALHKNPPTSTEQVLHPDLFLDKSKVMTAVPVEASDRSPMVKEKMGEFSWRFLLNDEAAAGWGGDTVQVVDKGEGRLGVFVDSSWDTEADAREFVDAYTAFLKTRSIEPEIRRQKRLVSVSYVTR
jgi:hypothetical protein